MAVAVAVLQRHRPRLAVLHCALAMVSSWSLCGLPPSCPQVMRKPFMRVMWRGLLLAYPWSPCAVGFRLHEGIRHELVVSAGMNRRPHESLGIDLRQSSNRTPRFPPHSKRSDATDPLDTAAEPYSRRTKYPNTFQGLWSAIRPPPHTQISMLALWNDWVELFGYFVPSLGAPL